MSINTFFQLASRVTAMSVWFFGFIRFSHQYFWEIFGLAPRSEEIRSLISHFDPWYLAGVVFGLMLMLLSPLIALVLPDDEKVPLQMNGLALVTVWLRILGWTTVNWQMAKYLTIRLGWLEYELVQEFLVLAVLGFALFWFAPQIAQRLIGNGSVEPAGQATSL